jgi:hypothetical protein
MVTFVMICVMAVPLTAQTAVRMNWQTFAKDPARVASFRRAVVTMRTLNLTDPASAQYRTSWEYWGNMHGYFGPESTFGTIMDWVNKRKIDLSVYGVYFGGVTNTTPPDAVAKAVWAQCQHGTPYFFAWHRLYLLYFEQVLQKSANDPTLRLPYWDYTDTANLAMPAEFTMPTYVDASGEVQPNPLFEVRRAPGWLTMPVHTLDPDLTDINSALTNPLLLNTTDAAGNPVLGYQSTIEQNVHGNIHCSVMDCPVPVMGAVPYSSNDPIFWLHHANIDRMWDCWTSIPGHLNPTDSSYLKQTFSYVNANGQEVTKSVNDIINGHMVDYVYEQASNCGRPEPAVLYTASTGTTAPATISTDAPAAATPLSAKRLQNVRKALVKPVVLATAKGVAINATTIRKQLPVLLTAAATSDVRELAANEHGEVPSETDLELLGIHYESHPGAMFKVFLERKDDPSKRVYVGTLSFFTPLDPPAEEHHPGSSQTSRTFDVTRQLHLLGSSGIDQLNVVFEAATGRLGSGERAHFNAQSNLVVDTIELRVKLRETAAKQ